MCLQSNLSPCCGLMRGSSPPFPYPFPVSRPSILLHIHPLLGQVTGINKSRHKQRNAKPDTSNATHKPRAPPKKARVKARLSRGQGREKLPPRPRPEHQDIPSFLFRRLIDSRKRSIALAGGLLVSYQGCDGVGKTYVLSPPSLPSSSSEAHQKQKKKVEEKSETHVVSCRRVVSYHINPPIHRQLTHSHSKKQASNRSLNLDTHPLAKPPAPLGTRRRSRTCRASLCAVLCCAVLCAVL
jgi:hypothetical protein